MVKKAFSLIELSLVLIIILIIVGFSFKSLDMVFKNISLNKLQTKNDIVLKNLITAINKRVLHSIKESIYFDANHKALVFIGIEQEAYRGYKTNTSSINQSHFRILDLDSWDKNQKTINILALNLKNSYNTIKDITKAKLTKQKDVVLILDQKYTLDNFWDKKDIYYEVVCADKKCNNTTLKFNKELPSPSTCHYYFSSSAYAIVLQNNILYLYRGFKPWKNQNLSKAKKYILAKNIDNFEYKNNILKICTGNLCIKRGLYEK